MIFLSTVTERWAPLVIHGVVALDKPRDRSRMDRALDDRVPARINVDFSIDGTDIACRVILDRFERGIEGMGVEVILAHVLEEQRKYQTYTRDRL